MRKRGLGSSDCTPIAGKVVKLSQLSRMPVLVPEHVDASKFSSDLIAKARAAQVSAGLRYNTATCVVSDKNGMRSRFAKKSDCTPHRCLEDVMRWEFSSWIRNSANRIKTGYKP
jgi:hypothetical protein